MSQNLSWFRQPAVSNYLTTDTTRSAGRVRNCRFLAQGRRSASSLRTPRGLTTRARIRSISLCGNVDATGTRMPLHRFAGTSRWNKHRDDRARGRFQNPLAQNDVRAGRVRRRWEARWNKWKGQRVTVPDNPSYYDRSGLRHRLLHLEKMEWTPPFPDVGRRRVEVDPRGPTASKCQVGRVNFSQANRRVRDED